MPTTVTQPRTVTLRGVCSDTRQVTDLLHVYDAPTRPYRCTVICEKCDARWVDDSGVDPFERSLRLRARNGDSVRADSLLRWAESRDLPVRLHFDHDRPGFVMRRLTAVTICGWWQSVRTTYDVIDEEV